MYSFDQTISRTRDVADRHVAQKTAQNCYEEAYEGLWFTRLRQTDAAAHNNSPKQLDKPASQAVEPIPPVSDRVKKAPDASSVVLNIQVTNVPEVSPGVDPRLWIRHVDAAFSAGAQAVRPIEQWMATPNAVNDALVSIGSTLDNAVNYYANTPADQVMRDAQAALGQIGDALDRTFSYPHTPEQRAKTAGEIMPLFFFEGDVRQSIHPETAKQLGLDGLKETELSELGILRITRKAGKGGDWPVINERPSPDVVQQATGEGCVAAIGEMLSEGKLRQDAILLEVGTVPERLAEVLGPEWQAFTVKDKEIALEQFLRRGNSWGAELRDDFVRKVEMGHMVVVDGLDEAGNVMIRDPQHATRYEMTSEAFLTHWSGRSIRAGVQLRK